MEYLIPLFLIVLSFGSDCFGQNNLPRCDNLQYLQYECIKPTIDKETYELSNCDKNGTTVVNCYAINGVDCIGSRNFTNRIPCRYTNGYKFSTALSLSIFLGPLGFDRFYLGYPAIGLLKLLTFGGFLVGNWIDFIMISTQRLKPADGSNYIIKTYGPIIKEGFDYENILDNIYQQDSSPQPPSSTSSSTTSSNTLTTSLPNSATTNEDFDITTSNSIAGSFVTTHSVTTSTPMMTNCMYYNATTGRVLDTLAIKNRLLEKGISYFTIWKETGVPIYITLCGHVSSSLGCVGATVCKDESKIPWGNYFNLGNYLTTTWSTSGNNITQHISEGSSDSGCQTTDKKMTSKITYFCDSSVSGDGVMEFDGEGYNPNCVNNFTFRFNCSSY